MPIYGYIGNRNLTNLSGVWSLEEHLIKVTGSAWVVETSKIAKAIWNQSADTYTSIPVADKNLDVQSRMRRCVLLDNGTVNYYLDADNSGKKAGDWLRIVETQAISAGGSGTHSESASTSLRANVVDWSAGTYSKGSRVIYNNKLWECIAATTSSTPAAGTVDSVLTGADGQVMVEVPLFSTRHTFSSNIHTWEVTLGTATGDGWTVHPSFLKADGTYRNCFYIGAYLVTGTSPATTVSGSVARVGMTRASQRSASSARGAGWHQWSFYELSAIQFLYLTEFQHFNSQTKLGNGASGGNTWSVASGPSNAYGNASQNVATSANSGFVSYRGIENPYGRTTCWIDGVNMNHDGTNRNVYVASKYSAFAGGTSYNHSLLGTISYGDTSCSGRTIGSSADVFLVTSYAFDFSTGTTDVMASAASSGWYSAMSGGGTDNGTQSGFFYQRMEHNDSSHAYSSVSSRLSYGTP